MITPNELVDLDSQQINKIISKIDTSIKEFHGSYPWEEAVIEGEYSDVVMNYVLKQYYDVGWKYMYWSRSSETERPGLTGIKFSTTPIDDKYVCKDHQFDANLVNNK